jgi:hypothetical protein
MAYGDQDQSAARPAGADTCPECGGAFHDVKRSAIDKDSRQADEIAKAREAIDAKRGALQACACGYQRRANDAIVPAEA